MCCFEKKSWKQHPTMPLYNLPFKSEAIQFRLSKSAAGTVEYTDCISAEG